MRRLYTIFSLVPIIIPFVKCQLILDLNSSDWSIYNSNQSIRTSGPVPGGVYSALESKVKISDILFGNNDVNYRWIGNEDWFYYREFEINSTHFSFPSVQLVLHGVDTLADVYINRKHVLHCDNMFIKYNTDIKSYLVEGKNSINIAIKAPINSAALIASRLNYTVPPICHPPEYNGECNINMLRKMQASFAWDWGPAFPSSGLWKPVEIVLSNGPIIRSMTVVTELRKPYWNLNVTVLFYPVDVQVRDILTIELSDQISGTILTSGKTVNLDRNTQSISLNVQIAESKVKTWWPNGYGEQYLYNLKAYYSHSEKTVQIGFRTIEVVQEDVSSDKSQGKTFYFLVNGVKVFAKGSNWIPSHVLPERLSDETRIVPLLEAAAEANTNMLRVWGGGVYESDLFYETCDRLGILIWQDFMFACSMYPVGDEFLASVEIEIKQQVERLQPHPSIAIWAGNNENEAALIQNWYGTAANLNLYKKDYVKLYVATIMPIVKRIDPSRTYVTSSPSNGVETETEGYISQFPGNPLYGDVHYYNYLANGWDYRIYPNPRFASEYGIISLPSIHCLRSAIPLGEMKWDSDSLYHRMHSPGGKEIIINQISFNLPISYNIYDIILLSQINQAMSMKTESEKYRRLKSVLLDSGEGYTMGALYWQLNDIWQAPSWSSIDYCGNWKMLHYFAKDFFSPIITSPQLSPDGSEISIYIVVDGFLSTSEANLTLNVHQWSSNTWNPIKQYKNIHVNVEENKSFVAYKILVSEVLQGCGEKTDCFISSSLTVNNKPIAPENFLFLAPLKESNYPEANVKITHISQVNNDTAEVTLTSDKYALFVWLDLDGLKGTFSSNGFHMTEPTKKVTFKSKAPLYDGDLDKITVNWLKRSYSKT